MKQLKRFDSKEVENLRIEFKKVLDAFSKKFKLNASIAGTINYGPNDANVKVNFSIKGATPEYLSSTGFVVKLPAIGSKFLVAGRTFEVSGHAPSRPKFPVIAFEVGVNTKRAFKFRADQVKEVVV